MNRILTPEQLSNLQGYLSRKEPSNRSLWYEEQIAVAQDAQTAKCWARDLIGWLEAQDKAFPHLGYFEAKAKVERFLLEAQK
jgi:hypothetical protein